ncbi:23S rRNA U2552 (ribose-2'-O)-methylase RlmE/FtsJ [Halapricum desulfuricans]|uniref:Ribosomal RNA large subunit methyltransferase E n=1 Tax=Halapricum desulfuricans TaxID=2841257 RepID=A0A897NHX8_9EURY|nr:23S rRNA (uridine(2552)-2'-O)-methyltransferase [Halapricum desulfuricans]QSG10573.1 23S rRNA U2552 (ribose-2'-O)-methylase RlmE/FtsJ [Halapricum desulfuricans]
MTDRDKYYNKAKQEGYRARSAYKLKQLDETAGLLGEGNTVIDLGAAPGGWLQVAAERVGSDGTVVGVDRQRIDPLEDSEATVEYVRGDMTDGETKAEIRDRVGAGDDTGGPADLVVSDMAPNVTGEYSVDHARSVHLARQAFEVALELLDSGGDFAAKVFDGQDLDDFEADVEAEFEYARRVRPDATRDSSSEVYLVGKGRLTAPVREGDTRDVEIVDTGRDGDGIAKIEGFTVFVSGVEEGETVTVRIDDVKPRYGFAQPIE